MASNRDPRHDQDPALRRAVACRTPWLAAALTLAAAAPAPSALAEGRPTVDTFIGTHSLKITATGFDFGGADWFAGAPVGPAKVNWYIVDGQMRPSVDGTLFLNDVSGQCARIRVDYYAGAGIRWNTAYGNEVCAPDDRLRAYTVDLGPVTSSKIDEVGVAVEKKTASGDWQTIGSQRMKLGTIHTPIKITGDGFDFGGSAFAFGAPTQAAQIAWTWSEGKLTPRVTGTLHLNNVAGACARLRLEYTSNRLEEMAVEFGGKVCAPDNAHHAWDVDLKPLSDARIHQLEVTIQSLGPDGTWRGVGTDWKTYVIGLSRCRPINTFDHSCERDLD